MKPIAQDSLAADTTEACATKRRRGRPKSNIELTQVTVYLRPDQAETLKRFAAKRHYVAELDNVSAVIRSLIDGAFPEGYGR